MGQDGGSALAAGTPGLLDAERLPRHDASPPGLPLQQRWLLLFTAQSWRDETALLAAGFPSVKLL